MSGLATATGGQMHKNFNHNFKSIPHAGQGGHYIYEFGEVLCKYPGLHSPDKLLCNATLWKTGRELKPWMESSTVPCKLSRLRFAHHAPIVMTLLLQFAIVGACTTNPALKPITGEVYSTPPPLSLSWRAKEMRRYSLAQRNCRARNSSTNFNLCCLIFTKFHTEGETGREGR